MGGLLFYFNIVAVGRQTSVTFSNAVEMCIQKILYFNQWRFASYKAFNFFFSSRQIYFLFCFFGPILLFYRSRHFGSLSSKCSYFVFFREAPSLCSLMWPWLWPVNLHRLSSVLPGMFIWTQVSSVYRTVFLNLTGRELGNFCAVFGFPCWVSPFKQLFCFSWGKWISLGFFLMR